MSTGDSSTSSLSFIVSSNSNSCPIITKGSRVTKRKPPRKSHSQVHFRFGGNRKDPLNLNGLIQKKKHLAQASLAGSTTDDSDPTTNHGNDRPVEILLPPDIFDPLRLDPSSRDEEDLNRISSVPSTSTTQQASASNPTVYPSRTKRLMKKRRHSQPPRYGNFQGYYGYRQPNHDQRLQYLQQDWFHEKQVLDIGCHTGHVTFYVGEHFQPRQILGLDIDQQLVQQARDQLWTRIQTANASQPPVYPVDEQNKRYPFNMRFQQGNFVLDTETELANVEAEYDTIIVFSVTKWIHLNFGDQGLKRFFKRIYRALYPGGKLLLEPQPWSSYRLKRRMTKEITAHYNQIQFKPTEFVSYLLSTEVGFETCTTVATPDHTHKGFQRSMFLFTKPSATGS